MSYFFTSESVTAGHPDKICDQISDAILDAYLAQDPHARVACECLVTTGRVVIAGEVRSDTRVDHEAIARSVINDIGYDDPELLFDAQSCIVTDLLHTQSADIALGVDTGGAGDQGSMFGYATDETSDMMPAPIWHAHQLAYQLHEVRTAGQIAGLRPDGKTQVTVQYLDDGTYRLDTIVISTQHHPDISQEDLNKLLHEHVIIPVCRRYIDADTRYHINPTGQFIIGGPHGDAGLTGRKIIVDTYGGMGRHGGGAFSGKDPTKVDRSGTYMARYLAKIVVSRGRAKKAEIQLSYAIGVKEPIRIFLETWGTHTQPIPEILQRIQDNVDCTPTGIINHLDLCRPIYQQTATYGHFGRKQFTWEQVERKK